MSLHSYLLFVLAAFALVLAPGPDMLYMLGRCVAQGRRAGILSALGFGLGGVVHITAAVLGLSAILAASPPRRSPWSNGSGRLTWCTWE